MLMLVLLTPPLILTRGLHHLPLGPMGLAGLGPPLIFVVSQRALYPNWQQRLLAFPLLMALSIGLAWNNTLAVLRGLSASDQPQEFQRTPKFTRDWSASAYALRSDRYVWGEIALAVYAFTGMIMAYQHYPPLVVYLGLCAFGFSLVAVWTLHDTWLISHHHPQQKNA
jgi:sterol desaturase/sphingolipid hydroxylase (fatty acid hydroxylase superfamily)